MRELLLLLFSLIGFSAVAQDKLEPWQDPNVNEVNRMAAHADFTNKNEWRMSLHGMWGEMPMEDMVEEQPARVARLSELLLYLRSQLDDS